MLVLKLREGWDKEGRKDSLRVAICLTRKALQEVRGDTLTSHLVSSLCAFSIHGDFVPGPYMDTKFCG